MASSSEPVLSLFTTGLIVTSGVIFPLLATIAVILRFKARRITKCALLSDDWTVVIALVLSWVCSLLLYVFAPILGVNTSSLSQANESNETFKFFWINQIFFTSQLGLYKISILLFYKRVFSTVRACKIAAWTLIVMVTSWTIAAVLVSIFECDPVSGAFTDFDGTLRIDYNTYSLATSGISMTFDVIILLLPLIQINQLQLSKQKKISISSIFALGFIVSAVSATRFALLYESVFGVVAKQSTFASLRTSFYFSGLEMNTAVVAACLPMLRPVFVKSAATGSSGDISGASRRGFGSRGWLAHKGDTATFRTYDRYQSLDGVNGNRLRSDMEQGKPHTTDTSSFELSHCTESPSTLAELPDRNPQGQGIMVTRTVEQRYH